MAKLVLSEDDSKNSSINSYILMITMIIMFSITEMAV